MDEHSNQTAAPSTRISRWRPALYFLAGGLLLMLLALGVITALDSDLDWSAETRLALLFLLTLLVLGFSVGGFGYVLRQAKFSPIMITLALAYGLPALVYALLGGALQTRFDPFSAALQQLSLLPGLFLGQPWLYLLPTLTLAFVGSPNILPVPVERSGQLPSISVGLLAGGLLGLAAGFAYSLSAAIVESGPAADILTRSSELPLLVRLVTLLVAVLIAPWAIERFFRGELLARWQPYLGRTGAALATAALYATLQFRPLMWLPAFLVGLGLAGLVQHTGRLREAIAAHAAANLVLYFLGWYLVI
jgi:membrane protease YdiL (CAAX protease family)